MGLNSCLPLLDASCFLLCKWLIGTVNIAVDRYIDFRGRRCFWSWILCASPHIQKATPELEKMHRCIRVHRCISSEDHQKYQVASAPETTKSRSSLLFEEDVSRGQWWLSLLVQETQGSKWACQTAVLKDRKILVYIICSSFVGWLARAHMIMISSFGTPHVHWWHLISPPQVAPQIVRLTLFNESITGNFHSIIWQPKSPYELILESWKGRMLQKQSWKASCCSQRHPWVGVSGCLL